MLSHCREYHLIIICLCCHHHITIFFKSRIHLHNMRLWFCYNVIVIVSPLVALGHHCFKSLFLSFRWVLVFLQQSFYQHTHFRTGRFLAVPVDGAVAAKLLCQFAGECHKLFVGISLADAFRRRQSIVEGFFFNGQPKLVAFTSSKPIEVVLSFFFFAILLTTDNVFSLLQNYINSFE